MPVKKVISDKRKVISKQKTAEAVKVSKSVTKRATGFSVPVYSLAGRASGTIVLPKEIFGKEVNKKLLAQALRVYMTNQKNLTASTKTRGMVRGSTAKIQRQKGTGKARHGSIRAPIFVGGGIVFGPKPRNVRLELPKKMRRAALFTALSAKLQDSGILGISGLEKVTGKTKEMAKFVEKVRAVGGVRGSALIVTGEKVDNVVRGVRNIPGVDVLPASLLNAYEILRHKNLLLTKDAIALLQHDRGGKTK